MKSLCLWGWLLAAATALHAAGPPGSDTNVNSRYTVEAVELPKGVEDHISPGLRQELLAMVGSKLNAGALDDFARRLRKDLRVRAVTPRLERGAAPDHVKIVFDVVRNPGRFEISVPTFLYHAKQGWSAALESTVRVKGNAFTAGLVSNGDELAERYSGVLARYERPSLGTSRARLGFEFESYHQQWNPATAAAQPAGEMYRTRHNFEPGLTLAVARPVSVTVGASFQRLGQTLPGAGTRSANAAFALIRLHQRIEGDSAQQEVDAAYSLRAGTGLLGTDYVYTRHRADLAWALTSGRHVLLAHASAGAIGGHAPLFERFILGASSTLRGWNKFDIAPGGGNRMAHNSVEYRYRVFQVFYDAGSVWAAGDDPNLRQSLGCGLRYSVFSLAVAFPVREGRVEPLFMVGMNY